MDLTVLAFGLLAAAFLALGYALGAARRRLPSGRGVTLAALWAATVSLLAASRFTHARPLLLGVAFPVAALAVGYGFDLIRSRRAAFLVAAGALGLWAVLFLFYRGVIT